MTMVDYHWIYDQFNANGTFLGHWIKLFISFGGSSIDLNIDWTSNKNVHSVWKSHKKSHSTLRAKRATFPFRIKNAKMFHFGEFFKLDVFGQTVLPDRLIQIGQKLVKSTKNLKIQMRHFGWFSNTVLMKYWEFWIAKVSSMKLCFTDAFPTFCATLNISGPLLESKTLY